MAGKRGGSEHLSAGVKLQKQPLVLNVLRL